MTHVRRPTRLPAYPLTRFSKHVGINGQINRYDEEPQQELDLSSERGGIEQRKDIVLDEAAGVGRAVRFATEPVFQRGKRADPTRKLDRGSPYRRRYVQVRDSGPPQHQQTAQHDEQHKEEVESNDDIGEKSVHYLLPVRLSARPPAYPSDGIHRRQVFRDGLP